MRIFISLLFILLISCNGDIKSYETEIINDNIELLKDRSWDSMKYIEEYATANKVKSGRFFILAQKADSLTILFDQRIEDRINEKIEFNDMKISYNQCKKELVSLLKGIKHNEQVFKSYDFENLNNSLLLMQLDIAYSKDIVLEVLESQAIYSPWFENK